MEQKYKTHSSGVRKHKMTIPRCFSRGVKALLLSLLLHIATHCSRQQALPYCFPATYCFPSYFTLQQALARRVHPSEVITPKEVNVSVRQFAQRTPKAGELTGNERLQVTNSPREHTGCLRVMFSKSWWVCVCLFFVFTLVWALFVWDPDF
jgi:hypothetical protein